MEETRTLTVTLPAEMVRMLEQWVSSGEYGSASDVVRDGLQRLAGADRFEPSDAWLRQEVLPVLEACEKDPSRMLSPEDVDRHFEELHSREMKARGRAA